jgi:hypothetical protein
MTSRVLAAAVLALGACTWPEPPTMIGSSTAGASSLASLYPDIALVGTSEQTERVSGTRDQFTIDGVLPNPFEGSPATVKGGGTIAGTAAGTAGTIHVEIALLEWVDEDQGVVLDGTLLVDEDATFAATGDVMPDDVETHVTGKVTAYGGGLDGNYDVDLLLCARDARSGWQGTVNGDDASAFTPGFDPMCAPAPPPQSM